MQVVGAGTLNQYTLTNPGILTSGDSWRTGGLHRSGGVNPGSVVLTWRLPCKEAAVPNQEWLLTAPDGPPVLRRARTTDPDHARPREHLKDDNQVIPREFA